MKVLTSAEMREIDRKTIREVGVPGVVLMENAGLRILEAIERRVPDLAARPVVIVAGKGNNGGDGLVVARHLFGRGLRPRVLLAAAIDEVQGDARVNLEAALKMGVDVDEVWSEEAWAGAGADLAGAGVIVDALFGTGLTKPLEGLYARIVETMNASPAFTVAVDIPSGLSSDAFETIGPCARADLTVTLGAPKIAHVFPPAEEFVGELVVAPIGIPPELLASPELKLEMVEPALVRDSFRARPRDAHKGTFGHVLIVAGSYGKTGAAALAGKAALRMGAGLVTVATAESALPVVARTMPELMTEPLPETAARTIARSALPRALDLLKGKDAVLVGPGLSTDPETSAFLLDLLPQVKVPIVIDADGLNILASRPGILDAFAAPAVLTPHPGEFSRLSGLPTGEVLRRRLELAPAFAAEHGLTLVFKGYRTLVCAPDGRVFINPTGNPGMATGGTGDVLSGLVASEIMQDRDVVKGAIAAVYAHGLSGDLAAARLSQKALTAGDLVRWLPAALKALEVD